MIEIDAYRGREELDLQLSDSLAPNSDESSVFSLFDIADRAQAEKYVRGIRQERWADVRPRDAALALARKDIADTLFPLSPQFRSDYTPEESQKAAYAIDLIIDATQRIIKTQVGHMGRPEDLWLEQSISDLNIRKSRMRIRENVVYMDRDVKNAG